MDLNALYEKLSLDELKAKKNQLALLKRAREGQVGWKDNVREIGKHIEAVDALLNGRATDA